MKTVVSCVREFDGLAEGDQPSYMGRMGPILKTNSGDFPEVLYPGTVITTHAGTLFNLFNAKDTSDDAMKAYHIEKALCSKMVNADYDGIDAVALGDGDIVAKGGVNGTSTNTTRVAPPGAGTEVKYKFSANTGQIGLGFKRDVAARGALVFTTDDKTVTIEASGDMQIKITVGTIVIFMDLTTGSDVLIQHLKKGMEITSTLALFNANGLSPLVTPPSVVIPI